MALSPLNQRRWRNFKANRRAYWSLMIFAVLFGLFPAAASRAVARSRAMLRARSA